MVSHSSICIFNLGMYNWQVGKWQYNSINNILQLISEFKQWKSRSHWNQFSRIIYKLRIYIVISLDTRGKFSYMHFDREKKKKGQRPTLSNSRIK